MGGTDHITHHLIYNGLSERQVVLFLVLVSMLSAALATWMIVLNEWTTLQLILLSTYGIGMFALIQVLYIRGASRKPAINKEEL